MVVASFPSPSQGVVHVGPLPLRAYAFMIILGAVVAVVVTGRRLAARGEDPKLAGDAAVPAVLCGILGARIYHVLSSPDKYFGDGGSLVNIFKIWEGGLAIWGAIAGGALGVWLVCRSRGVSMALFSDAAAPGLALAQAIGRWGNYFNQELYGRATDLPWALEIDARHRPLGETADTFHPTFLYESLWNLAVAALLLVVDRRRRLGRGKLFALYVAAYTAGRVWIETLRVDPAEHVLGLRLNVWVSLVLLLAAVAVLLFVRTPVDRPVPVEGPVPVDRPVAVEGPAADAPSDPAKTDTDSGYPHLT